MRLNILMPAALMILAVSCSDKGDATPDGGQPPADGVPTKIALPVIGGDTTIVTAATANYCNVMGERSFSLPQFPNLAKKAGVLRGFVTKINGEPVEGAFIGIRSTAIGGTSTGADGVTNAKGYYEISLPAGVISFWAGGILANYGPATAPMGMMTTDGHTNTFASTEGGIKHFVVPSWGIADKADVVGHPYYGHNYFGGSIHLNYDVDGWLDPRSLPTGSEITIKLTPADAFFYGESRSFIIKIAVGHTTYMDINNIPVGKYKIEASLKVEGQTEDLFLEAHGPDQHPVYGLKPVNVKGSSFVTFRPSGTTASSAMPNRGAWTPVNVHVERDK